MQVSNKTLGYLETVFDCAIKSAHDVRAEVIILFSDNTQFAKHLSKYRPPCTIAFPTNNNSDFKCVRIVRGVIPFFYKNNPKREDIIKLLINHFKRRKIIDKGEIIIVVNAYLDLNIRYKNGLFIICNDNK